MSLTSSHQCVPPRATNLTVHTSESIQISRDRVVVEVPLDHAIEPFAHNGDGFMPPAHQLCPDSCKCCSHSLLDRQAYDLESALPFGATAVRESKEVERFRPALSPTFAIGGGESTKLQGGQLACHRSFTKKPARAGFLLSFLG